MPVPIPRHKYNVVCSLAIATGFLAYKSCLAGKRVMGISEANTSRTCCVCGKSCRMPLGRRTIECDCGDSIDCGRNHPWMSVGYFTLR